MDINNPRIKLQAPLPTMAISKATRALAEVFPMQASRKTCDESRAALRGPVKEKMCSHAKESTANAATMGCRNKGGGQAEKGGGVWLLILASTSVFTALSSCRYAM